MAEQGTWVKQIAVISADGKLLGHLGMSPVDIQGEGESVELTLASDPSVRERFPIVIGEQAAWVKLDNPQVYAGFTPLPGGPG